MPADKSLPAELCATEAVTNSLSMHPRISAEHRIDLHHHVVLFGLGVNGGDLTLAGKRVIERPDPSPRA